MQSSRSRRAGDGKGRRQNGFLPDFRAAINAARSPREGARAPADAYKDATLQRVRTRRRLGLAVQEEPVDPERHSGPLIERLSTRRFSPLYSRDSGALKTHGRVERRAVSSLRNGSMCLADADYGEIVRCSDAPVGARWHCCFRHGTANIAANCDDAPGLNIGHDIAVHGHA